MVRCRFGGLSGYPGLGAGYVIRLTFALVLCSFLEGYDVKFCSLRGSVFAFYGMELNN